ncbi:hypothetical protein BZA77DRAFT_364550 [Pyronema omphalodes]|nr:hypothetical protein BZA77DRAFT_364550 [Pyronema omphalodes]
MKTNLLAFLCFISTVAGGELIKIHVGRDDHKFTPDVHTANIGDEIVFEFWPKNHSVVVGSYEVPCAPVNRTDPTMSKKFYWSGFVNVPTTGSHGILGSETLKIVDKEPIYFYCSAPGSCINYAMVGIINPRNSSEIEVLKSRARKMSFSLSPGEEPPSDHIETHNDSKPAPPAATAAARGNSETPSGGAIAGIVIGAVVAVSLIGLLFFLIGRKKSASRNADSETTASSTETTEFKPSAYPSPQSAFQDAAETDYRYSRHQHPDPNTYPSNGRRMSSPMSEFNGAHGAWRESRQSTMTRPVTMPMPIPVELDNGDETNQREMWNQNMQYQPDGSDTAPVYQQVPSNTMSSVSPMGTMSTINQMGAVSPTSPRNELDNLVGDGYLDDEKRAF